MPSSPAVAPRAASGSASEPGAVARRGDAGEGLGRADRLRRRVEFLRCYRQGRRRKGALLYLAFAANETGTVRLGITASRKVGGAVVRNRLKRRVREIVRRWPERRRLAAMDLVVHLHPTAATASFATLERELVTLLGSLPRRPAAALEPGS